MASAEGYLAGVPFNNPEDILKLPKGWEYVGSNPTVGASWPRALTHSPTPGSKKCGVLSKGFLASKSKPVYRSNNSTEETAAYRRMLVRLQLERLSFAGEMIYLAVELNFHKTIIIFIIV